MGATGAITDVAGIRVGHVQKSDDGWLSGVTVVLPPPGTVGSVDVRGGGPATHETDSLDPTTLSQTVDAVVLTGGSAFGLAAAHGAQRWCEENGRGFPVPGGLVPIVPAAAIFDLGRGGDFSARPDEAMGYAATAAAAAQPEGHDVERGNVGAGTGAAIGRGTYKGGVGTASLTLRRTAVVVGAIAVVNALGLPFGTSPQRVEPGSVRLSDEGASTRGFRRAAKAAQASAQPSRRPLNTTLVVVATERRPGQGRLQADGLRRPCRAGPGAESEPHPRRRRHRVRPGDGRRRTGPQHPGGPADRASSPCRARQPTSSGWPSWTGSRGRRQ